MLEVVAAFVGGEGVEDLAAQVPELIDRARGTIAEQLLELRKCWLDGVQVGGIRGQVTQLGADCFKRFTHAFDFMAGEIVHHDNVAR